MRPLRYSINVTLDGCCDHREGPPDEETHRHATKTLDQADALLFGRVTYEMMESAWRPPGQTEAMPDWMAPFGRTIDAAKKYVVSSTLDRVDWNAELVRGDLGEAVQELKRESGKGLLVGGVKLPLALAELGLIDEYEFVVQPRLVGHGPTLFAGLSKRVDLRLVGRLEFGSGAVAMRYEPRASDSALALKRRTRLRSRAANRRSGPRSSGLDPPGERAPLAGSRGRSGAPIPATSLWPLATVRKRSCCPQSASIGRASRLRAAKPCFRKCHQRSCRPCLERS